MTRVLIRDNITTQGGTVLWRDRHKQEEHHATNRQRQRQEGWSCKPEMAQDCGPPPEARKRQGGILSRVSEGAWPHGDLDFPLLASRTVTEHISAALNQPVCRRLLRQPKEANTLSKMLKQLALPGCTQDCTTYYPIRLNSIWAPCGFMCRKKTCLVLTGGCQENFIDKLIFSIHLIHVGQILPSKLWNNRIYMSLSPGFWHRAPVTLVTY